MTDGKLYTLHVTENYAELEEDFLFSNQTRDQVHSLMDGMLDRLQGLVRSYVVTITPSNNMED